MGMGIVELAAAVNAAKTGQDATKTGQDAARTGQDTVKAGDVFDAMLRGFYETTTVRGATRPVVTIRARWTSAGWLCAFCAVPSVEGSETHRPSVYRGMCDNHARRLDSAGWRGAHCAVVGYDAADGCSYFYPPAGAPTAVATAAPAPGVPRYTDGRWKGQPIKDYPDGEVCGPKQPDPSCEHLLGQGYKGHSYCARCGVPVHVEKHGPEAAYAKQPVSTMAPQTFVFERPGVPTLFVDDPAGDDVAE